VSQGLVRRPLPRFTGEAQPPPAAPAPGTGGGNGSSGSLFEPPAGRERERSQ
jgi:hypothetical protein